jgi:hypothetical protein
MGIIRIICIIRTNSYIGITFCNAFMIVHEKIRRSNMRTFRQISIRKFDKLTKSNKLYIEI